MQGIAFGGGMGLASACDICVASSDAKFATSEVRLGLAPSTISPYVIRADWCTSGFTLLFNRRTYFRGTSPTDWSGACGGRC